VFDVIIVGGGPAGLSAALVLGRCRRRVLLCDAAQPRNGKSAGLHGYLTRDGTPPLEFLRLGREDVKSYGIEPCHATVTELASRGDGFEATLDSGRKIQARTALLATGVRDHVPDIPGIDACYGVTVHHCPYCDGWEERDKMIAVIGRGTNGAGLALSMKTWTPRVVLCTNGASRIRASDRLKLAGENIAVHVAPIARVEHEQQQVRAIVFAGGATVPCDAIFFSAGQSPQCDLAVRLGCEINRQGVVKTGSLGQTCVPGLYVVGDASHDVQFVIVAAAEGAKAAVAINKALQERVGLTVNS
jgi:thioredoxin reductase